MPSVRVRSVFTLSSKMNITAFWPLAAAAAWAGCDKPVYLTLDTGHMGVAPLVAEVLVDGNEVHVIRERETLEHLLKGERPLP